MVCRLKQLAFCLQVGCGGGVLRFARREGGREGSEGREVGRGRSFLLTGNDICSNGLRGGENSHRGMHKNMLMSPVPAVSLFFPFSCFLAGSLFLGLWRDTERERERECVCVCVRVCACARFGVFGSGRRRSLVLTGFVLLMD